MLFLNTHTHTPNQTVSLLQVFPGYSIQYRLKASYIDVITRWQMVSGRYDLLVLLLDCVNAASVGFRFSGSIQRNIFKGWAHSKLEYMRTISQSMSQTCSNVSINQHKEDSLNVRATRIGKMGLHSFSHCKLYVGISGLIFPQNLWCHVCAAPFEVRSNNFRHYKSDNQFLLIMHGLEKSSSSVVNSKNQLPPVL